MPDGIRPKYTPKNFKTLRKKIGEYVYDRSQKDTNAI